jgi:hypothetical protein
MLYLAKRRVTAKQYIGDNAAAPKVLGSRREGLRDHFRS